MKKKFLLIIIAIIPFFVSAQHFGENNHPMNKLSGNLDILKYWNNNSEEEIEIYESLFNLLLPNKNTSYDDLLLNKDYIALCQKHNILLLGGPILGNIKENEISIWLRSSMPSKLQIELSSKNKTFLSDTIHTQIHNELAGIIKIEGLTAATTYKYQIIVNDSVKISNHNFHFKTLPSIEKLDSVRIAFGSCPHRWGLGNEKLFNTIKERSPSAMLLLGDIAVQDRNNNYAMHRADYLLRDFQTAWKNFACSVPVYASWDDHDYFDNDKAGIPEGYTDDDRKMVRNIFKNSWVNPSYGLNNEGVYFKTQIGCAEVIMTDNRYFRNAKKEAFLGDMQMEWLKEKIKNCKSPFLILSCGTMWSDYVSDGKDSWGVNDPSGRDEIFDLLENNGVSTVLLISGDRHGARGFTIQRETGFEFYEFGMASLGARVGPPKTKSEWTTQLYGIDGTFAFGEFTLTNTDDKKNAIFRLIREDGSILYEAYVNN